MAMTFNLKPWIMSCWLRCARRRLCPSSKINWRATVHCWQRLISFFAELETKFIPCSREVSRFSRWQQFLDLLPCSCSRYVFLFQVFNVSQKWNVHQHDKRKYNFSHVSGVSPDSKVDTDLGGETNEIISKLGFKLLGPYVFDNFSCVLNNFWFPWLFCVPFSAACLGLFQVTVWMVPMWRCLHLRRF